MAIKELKTRIALRTGDYAYWTTGAGKDIELYKGEVCVCTVATADNQATNAPTVLFKVANENGQKFADLNWVSGLAADVYDWAKAAKAPDEIDTRYAFDIVDGKLQVTETKYIDEVAQTPVVKSYDFVTPTELETSLANYYTKTEIDNKLDAIDDKFENLDESITTVTKGTGISVTDAGTGNDHAYTVALDVNGAKTALGLGTAAYENAGAFEVAGAAADLEERLKSGDVQVNSAELADEAAKVQGTLTVKVGGVDIAYNGSADKTADVDAAINAAEERAKAYADQNDTNTAHTHKGGLGTIVNDEGGTDAKAEVEVNLNLAFEPLTTDNKIRLVDATSKTLVAEFNAVEFVKDSFLKSASYNDDTNDLTFVFVDKDGNESSVPVALDDLVDIYVGDETTITLTTSGDGKVFKIKDGGVGTTQLATSAVTTEKIAKDAVTEAKLDEDVRDALDLARSALQSHQDISGKADKKVPSASGNFAALDANGNLADSGTKAADFLTVNDFNTAGSTDITVEEGIIQLNSEVQGVYKIYDQLGDGNYIDFRSGENGGSLELHTYSDFIVTSGNGQGYINGGEILTTNNLVTSVDIEISNEGSTYEPRLTTAIHTSLNKADSALQEVEAGIGLKVAEGTSNKIEIDDEVIFVLNANF